MREVKFPTCGKRIMSIKEVKRILRNTFNKVLLSQCLCGESYEIRSPRIQGMGWSLFAKIASEKRDKEFNKGTLNYGTR
jgi:hypothetical protein